MRLGQCCCPSDGIPRRLTNGERELGSTGSIQEEENEANPVPRDMPTFRDLFTRASVSPWLSLPLLPGSGHGLAQTFKIGDQRLHLSRGQAQRGHVVPWLDVLGVGQPLRQMVWGLG